MLIFFSETKEQILTRSPCNSPGLEGPSELFSSLSVCRPSSVYNNKKIFSSDRSVNFVSETLAEYPLYGSPPKLCPMNLPSNQDGSQASKIKRWGWNFKNVLLWNYKANLNQTLLKWSLDNSLSK